MQRELAQARNDGLASTLPPELFEPAIASIRKAVTAESLATPWKEYRQYLTDAHRQALAWLSAVAASDEEQISDDVLSELSSTIGAFKEELISSDFPSDIKTYLLVYLQLLEDALWLYPIAGKRAFTEGLGKTASHFTVNMVVHEAAQADPQARSALDRLGMLWKTAADAGNVVQLGQTIFNAVWWWLSQGAGSLPQLPPGS